MAQANPQVSRYCLCISFTFSPTSWPRLYISSPRMVTAHISSTRHAIWGIILIWSTKSVGRSSVLSVTGLFKSLTMNIYSNKCDLKNEILSSTYKHRITPHNKHTRTVWAYPACIASPVSAESRRKREKMKEKWKGVKQFTVERFQSNSPPFSQTQRSFPLSHTHTRSSRTLLSLMTMVIHRNELWCKCE